MEKQLCQRLASLVDAYNRCIKKENSEWLDKHQNTIESLVKQHMPSGSGFDAGTTLNLDKSTGEKLVFVTSFHHMNENGFYEGWSEHVVTVKSSLQFGFTLNISGKNVRGIKEYMYEIFDASLRTIIKD